MSPTVAEGKHIYREACEEGSQWNKEVSPSVKKDWIKWTSQLRNIKVPTSLTKDAKTIKAVHLHTIADASKTASATATIAVIEHETGRVMGSLTTNSRIAKISTSIARLELFSGHMGSNLIKNLCQALKNLLIASITV